MKDYEDVSVLSELITRVFCDVDLHGGVADGVFLFAQTLDNEKSVLAKGVQLWNLGCAKQIFIIDLKKSGFGFSGFNSWKKKLIKAGIPATCIIGIYLVHDIHPSTDAEALSLIRFIKKNNLHKVYIVAHPLHQLRAFISSVSAMKREKTEVHLFNFVGFPQRWDEYIVHSQGIQRGTRSALISKELEKIIRYFKKGDLISPRGVLKYMNSRDAR